MGESLVADVVVVGAGVAGALAAYRLARAGVKVLVLDSGPRVERSRAVEAFLRAPVKSMDCPYPRSAAAPAPVEEEPQGYYVQEGPDLFRSTYLRLVGGTTWHWLGTAIRLLPEDFAMKTQHGVGVDWPLRYDQIERWYTEAEMEMGVAGEGDLGSPRSKPYPMGAIPLSYSDQHIARALAPTGLVVTATPQARNSRTYDDRPPCCGSSSCIPICPVGAKYDASTHVRKAEEAGARIVEEAIARFVEVGASGRVGRILFNRPDGSAHEARGRLYVLAAHAIETPKLLLASRTAALPGGVANSSDQVGRNLMDHPVQLSYALAKDPLGQLRGPLSTAGIDGTRRRPDRGKQSAFRVELSNSGFRWPVGGPDKVAVELIAKGLRGKSIAREIAARCTRQLTISSLMEQLPDPDNRVVAAFDMPDALGIPRPRLRFQVDAYTREGMEAARAIHDTIFDALGATSREHQAAPEGAGHVMGTYRMGASPKTSVVDAQSRTHDHPNLYLLGSGVFPTAGTANPTLTIAALALRAAEAMLGQLRR